ncbi:hypothetical protein [uncultured Roseibium sp.]|uniref:hypothetical protein n=1 Tax=uncultured Roseibium sp. TaxID=1936171 RepID=UPI00262D8A87|nr:hypothetical protein [uncultured Roseibium sp.]
MKSGRHRTARILAATMLVMCTVLFAASSATNSSLSLPSVSYGQVYVENIPQRVVPLVVQSIRVEAPADKTISNGLQKDDWLLEPSSEFSKLHTGRTLGRLDPPHSEWIDAASAGFVATVVSLSIMFSAGVRINWA